MSTPIEMYLTIFAGNDVFRDGEATIGLDQYGNPPFSSTVIETGQRKFVFPAGTYRDWGGTLYVTADGYQPFQARFVLIPAPDGNPNACSTTPNEFSIDAQPDFPTTPPSRDSAIRSRVGFQGLSVSTEQFGVIPAWGPELGSLSDADADRYVQQAMAAGFDAVEFAVSWNYNSGGYQYPVPGSDYSQNLPELRRRVKAAITVGAPLGLQGVYLFCAGDGRGAGPGYNDPGGWTYGREWLLANFQRIYAAFGPQSDDPIDLRPWMLFSPGYDGCDSYGWNTPENVAEWWHLQRRTIDSGGGYAAFEWSAGKCQLGDGFPTYSQENGGCIDVWLLELPPGPYPPVEYGDIQAITQQLGRMCRPYHRPSWAVDDPNPPYYGPFHTSRGDAIVQVYEFDTYRWVRGMAASQVEADRNIIRGIVPETVIC